MINLEGKTAVVTGGSRGIGRAICLGLAQCGAQIVFGYQHNQDAAEETASLIRAHGVRVEMVRGDVASARANEMLFQRAKEVFGAVDIAVCNAGIWRKAPIDEMSEDEWRETMKINLDAGYLFSRMAASVMKNQKFGKLIFIASTAGVRGEAYHAHYAASKGAILALTRSLASELGYYNINVNCVAPGWVETDMTAHVFEDDTFRRTVRQSIPLRRIGSPEDIAGPVVFLASSLARHIQGEIINVNGGSVMF